MKPILLVVSEVGYTWEEVFSPFVEFSAQNYPIVIATPNGKTPKADPFSLREIPILNQIGLGISGDISPETEAGKKLLKLLEKPLSLAKIEEKDYSGVYIAGGHGSLFDLNKNSLLHKLILKFDEAGKPLGVICHASSTLAFIKRGNKPFLEGRNVTGFPTFWEKLALLFGQVNPEFLPLPIWTGEELNNYATGRTFSTKVREIIDLSFTIRDKNIISGVGPKAGKNVAKKLLSLI